MDLRLVLAGVLATGAAIGFALPGDKARPTALPTFAPPPPVPSAAPAGWGGEMVLARRPDGHFYADVEIAGARVEMLVDTGASVVALTGDDAARLGITWHEGEVRPVAQGASGPVNGVPIVLPQLALGPFEAREVRAIVVPEGLPVSLLGQAFLSTLGGVEIVGDHLRVEG